MFRSIIYRVIKPIEYSAEIQKFRFCTKVQPLNRFRREVNDVEIVGTLINDSFTLQSGTKSLTIRTNDSPTKHSNHKVHLRSEADFTAGQRVFVTGKLRSNAMPINDGRMITSSTIKALQLYVLDNECGSTTSTSDRNYVKLLGNVSSEITSRPDHGTFALATHHKIKNTEDGTESDGTSFHRVFTYNTELCRYIENKLKKRDRVLLTGKIAHMTYTGDDDKKIYSSFIVADSIYRISSRASSTNVASDETTETAQLSSEN